MLQKPFMRGSITPVDTLVRNLLKEFFPKFCGPKFLEGRSDLRSYLNPGKFIFQGDMISSLLHDAEVCWMLELLNQRQLPDLQFLYDSGNFLQNLTFVESYESSGISIVSTTIGSKKYDFKTIERMPLPFKKEQLIHFLNLQNDIPIEGCSDGDLEPVI